MDNKYTVAGLEFEAVRATHPIPHWKLKLPNGTIWDSGVAGIDGSSRPRLWASLDDLALRVGAERFVRDMTL